MSNMPTITYQEAALLAAAVLVLYLGPLLMAAAARFRRWRQLELEAQRNSAESAAALALGWNVAGAESGTDQSGIESGAVDAVAAAESIGDAAGPAVTIAAVAEPQHFRLEDLHEVRLPNWPPAAVGDSEEESRLWAEAERIAAAHRQAIFSTILSSPCLVRSACLGGAQAALSTLRLRYMLFPAVWPLSAEQAVADAVFEVDQSDGSIRSWVEARPPAASEEIASS